MRFKLKNNEYYYNITDTEKKKFIEYLKNTEYTVQVKNSEKDPYSLIVKIILTHPTKKRKIQKDK